MGFPMLDFHTNRLIGYMVFCDWPFSFGIIFLRFIQVLAYSYFIPFYGQIHCMNVPYLVYSFVHSWAFGLFPSFDYDKNAVNISVGWVYRVLFIHQWMDS